MSVKREANRQLLLSSPADVSVLHKKLSREEFSETQKAQLMQRLMNELPLYSLYTLLRITVVFNPMPEDLGKAIEVERMRKTKETRNGLHVQ